MLNRRWRWWWRQIQRGRAWSPAERPQSLPPARWPSPSARPRAHPPPRPKSQTEKFIPIVRKAAAFLLARTYTRVCDRDLRGEQAKACFAVAQTYVCALQAKGLGLGDRFVFDPVTEPASQMALYSETNALIADHQAQVCRGGGATRSHTVGNTVWPIWLGFA